MKEYGDDDDYNCLLNCCYAGAKPQIKVGGFCMPRANSSAFSRADNSRKPFEEASGVATYPASYWSRSIYELIV